MLRYIQAFGILIAMTAVVLAIGAVIFVPMILWPPWGFIPLIVAFLIWGTAMIAEGM